METKPSYTDDNMNFNWDPNNTNPYPYYPTPRHIKRTTKTIEKWGPDGEYLGREVITTDEEDVVEQVYGTTITVSGDGTYSGDIASVNTTFLNPNGCNWSYTNGSDGQAFIHQN